MGTGSFLMRDLAGLIFGGVAIALIWVGFFREVKENKPPPEAPRPQ